MILLAERNGKRRRISDTQKKTYLALGYTILNDKGEVIAEPKSTKKSAEATTEKQTMAATDAETA